MNKHSQAEIPIEVIAKGRKLDDVLSAFMEIYERAKAFVTKPGKSEDDIFAETLEASAYRIYLLGVEDGIKGVQK